MKRIRLDVLVSDEEIEYFMKDRGISSKAKAIKELRSYLDDITQSALADLVVDNSYEDLS